MSVPAFSRLLRLSPNFMLAEFVSPNDPDGWAYVQANWSRFGPRLFRLANNVLQPARAKFGHVLHVTSGVRSPSFNRSIGGAKASRHMEADAADCWADRVPLDDLHAFLATLPDVGGLAMRAGAFVHVDCRARVGGQIVRWTY